MLCPCGSALSFSQCCQPFIESEGGRVFPKSAEQLMRSRFSAYATKNGAYIYHTYADATRVSQSLDDIQQWANHCLWLALKIRKSTAELVEFSAYYIADNTLFSLTERSTFVIENGLWRYFNGIIDSHKIIAAVKRNDSCPCNNYPTAFTLRKGMKGKKFKHCCGRINRVQQP